MRATYDAEQDLPVIERVAGLAPRYQVAMVGVALAWLWAKDVAAPIVGCSLPSRVDDAVRALDLNLSEQDLAWFEGPYQPQPVVGALARPGERRAAGSPIERRS